MSQLEPAIGKPQIHHLCLGLSEFKDNASTIQNCRDVTSALAREGHCDTVSDYGQRYRRNHRLVMAEGKTLFLQFDPLQEKDAMLRCELNPITLGTEGMARFQEILKSLLLDEFGPALISAKLSEINVVIPITNTRVRDLFFFDQHKRKSAAFFSANGEPYMIRIGAPQSDLSFEFCNFREVHKQDPKVIHGVNMTLKIIGRTWTLAQFLQSHNPFASLQIWGITTAPTSEKLTWKLFMAACRHRGAAAALKLIKSREKRELFRDKLTSQFNADWWLPESAWSGTAKALRATGLFPKSAHQNTDPTDLAIASMILHRPEIDQSTEDGEEMDEAAYRWET